MKLTIQENSLKLTILGNPTTKKNSQQIRYNVKTGQRFIGQGERYKLYANQFIWQIPYEAKLHIDYPINVKCVYYRENKRRIDLSNLLSATNDLLVDSGVLKDDNCKIIVSHDGSEVRYDKDNPRVEIEIEAIPNLRYAANEASQQLMQSAT